MKEKPAPHVIVLEGRQALIYLAGELAEWISWYAFRGPWQALVHLWGVLLEKHPGAGNEGQSHESEDR